MVNIIPLNIATPTIETITEQSNITVPTGNTLSLEPWFISSPLNDTQDNVSTYKIVNTSIGNVFNIAIDSTELNVFVSFLCNRDIKPAGNNWIELFNSRDSNMKCFYVIRTSNTAPIQFNGDLGNYFINFINVSEDVPFYFNEEWDNYACQTAIINGLHLSQFGFQVVDYLEYNMGYSRADKTNTSSKGHSIVQDGYDIITNEIKLRLEFMNIPGLRVGENYYDAAMRTVNNLINFIRDNDLYVSYKQQEKVYNHCKFNQIMTVTHGYNILEFTLQLVKINCKGTTTFSLGTNKGLFNPVEFIMRGDAPIIIDNTDESNYLYINGSVLTETMFNKVNMDNSLSQSNLNHFKDNSYSPTNTEIFKTIYLS